MTVRGATPRGLYLPRFERDSCGFGLIAQMDDQPSHWLVRTAVESLARLSHRGAIAADGKTGDGCGLLLKHPDGFFRQTAAELGIEQVFVNAPASMRADAFERQLFVARRRAELALADGDRHFYVPSLSARVVSYKGLMMPAYLPAFYPDLRNAAMESSLCVFHQRFSTNTWPEWRLAQPFRFLAHNGEINTIQGNRHWAEARSFKFRSQLLPELEELRPLVSLTGSDSCSLDNMLEVLVAGGMDMRLRSRNPYRKWIKSRKRQLKSTLEREPLTTKPFGREKLKTHQKLFQVSFEEREQVLRVLAELGQEAVGSMGDDTPLPVLSRHVRSIYDSFRQQFAQVTNPPIDPLREQIVMSLETSFAGEGNPFEELEGQVTRLVANSPVLSQGKFEHLLEMSEPEFRHERIDLNYPDTVDLEAAVRDVCDRAVDAVRSGNLILVISDRAVRRGHLPVHALLATGAIHHRLIGEGLRCDANIVVETGTARDPHHFAVLIGYGATAVYPYLAFETLNDMLRSGEPPTVDPSQAGVNYRRGINKGLYKITSKMGISTITSYRGAQLFEIVGLHDEVVDLCFRGTVSRLQGMNFADLDHDRQRLAWEAWNARRPIDQGGLHKYVHEGEYHAFNPDVIGALQSAVGSGDYRAYRVFADLVDGRQVATLRDLLKLRDDVEPVPIAEVEPAESVLPRFDSAGMSLGALSPEAHETLARAMNQLGGRSNSGEGGEDVRRYGTDRVSKIKQVASGRFGVTPHYLVNSEVLQIKIAQGAKPGEGGQLPGHKVNETIARLRYSRPGVALISPPPHHDIYSIEDLAQLIFDLKQVNPNALVSVKLVSEAGVGTVAAGVAKAYADLITIAGHDGGTGASPLTSVKYAGSPWELGLIETHQILRANDLRDKVRLQADGGLKTGLDVIKAAILGAESFGFGTAPMVAMGCKYLRICHLNNCATGVATQNNVLRLKHFKPDGVEKVKNYFRFVAEDVREWLARLGVRSLPELIGRTDLLVATPGETPRQGRLDLSPLISGHGVAADKPQFCTLTRNRPFDKAELAEQMVADALPAIENRSGGEFSYRVRNYDRSIGARLSGEIAKRHGNQGMADAPVTLRLAGTAGQSFGVWNAGGLHMYLEGDANDYVGKGMAGGKVVIRPPRASSFKTHEAVIVGNTCLYGATGGTLFASGLAGERFAVRNSGATAVVEGVGDHGCEYMTGGVVAVLGRTGLNFGAGMTGGFAFVLDLERAFFDLYNHELIDIHRIHSESMEAHANYLRNLLEEFVRETDSKWGRSIVDDFDDLVRKFWLAKPKASDLGALLDTLREAA